MSLFTVCPVCKDVLFQQEESGKVKMTSYFCQYKSSHFYMHQVLNDQMYMLKIRLEEYIVKIDYIKERTEIKTISFPPSADPLVISGIINLDLQNPKKSIEKVKKYLFFS